ncbi:MAG: ABC transporter ATP-binding protein, partial [Chloroflexi bacterium]
NGAGKSTTIRTLATLQQPDAGTIILNGIDVLADPDSARACTGYMPDVFGVYDSLTVGEYLGFYAASYGIPAGRRRTLCDELLELVDLTDQRDQTAESLSRGLKQRLGLARCLIHDPEVLLLDEPASGMDPRGRIELREILRELSKLDKTILISSTILPELAAMCTHVGIIRAGEMVAEGPVGAVITALSSGPRLRIRVPHPGEVATALAALDSDPRCDNVELEDDHTVIAAFDGTAEDGAAILAQFTTAGIVVTGFALESGTLEESFLHATELMLGDAVQPDDLAPGEDA